MDLVDAAAAVTQPAAAAVTQPATPTRTAAAEPVKQSSPTTPLSSISTNARLAETPLQKIAPRALDMSCIRMIDIPCSGESNSDLQHPVRRRSSSGRAVNTLEWKLAVASNSSSPARENLSRATLYRYQQKQNQFKAAISKRTKRSLRGSGRKPILAHVLENAIIVWMHSRRDRYKKVRGKDIVKQAKRLAELYHVNDFKASKGWLYNFKKRHHIRWRRITSLSRKYSNMQLEEYQKEYSREIISLKNRLHIREEETYNLDETPLWFDTPGKFTCDFVGANSVAVETTGHAKDRITLVLCISWKGEKLPPLVIFKSRSKKHPIIKKFTDNYGTIIYYCGQKKATNTAQIMVAWIEHVFAKRDNPSRRSILTMDNVKFHHSTEVKEALRNQKVTVSHFPPNTTCRLQPLDHNINGVIKNKMDEYWNDYMDDVNLPRTKKGNFKIPAQNAMLTWISRAFRDLKPDTIINSFNSCWLCEKKNDLVVVKPEQAALSMAIAPIPAITDISNDLMQTYLTMGRHNAIPARSPIYGPMPAPWTVTCPIVVPLLSISDETVVPTSSEDNDSGSDYSENDTDRDDESSDSDSNYDEDEVGDGDSESGVDDDDDDDHDGTSSTCVNAASTSKRARLLSSSCTSYITTTIAPAV
jgi:hypothetical protein